MIIRSKTTLPNPSMWPILAAVLDVVLLLFIATPLGSNVLPSHGVAIRPVPSQFYAGTTGKNSVVSVTAGSQPIFFLDEQRIEGGIPMLSRELDQQYKESNKTDRITITLLLDKDVTVALEQELIELILNKGMNCARAAEPAL